MLQETSPKAHEAIAHMPPADYERLGSAVLRLAHNSTLTQTGTYDFATYEQVPPSQHTPEQAQAHTRVGEIMASVSGYLAGAHGELEESRPTGSNEQDPYQRDQTIFSKAKETALTDAVKAHEQGETEVAEKAVESLFALAMIEGSRNDSSREIRELVAAGMAEDVVAAATNMHGVVALNGPMGPKPVWQQYGATTGLLQIATEKTFDDQLQHVTSLRDVAESDKKPVVQRLEEQLKAEDNIALAKLEINVRSNAESAMHNLVDAGDKVLEGGGGLTVASGIVDIVRLSSRCVEELQTTEASTAYHEITNKLRARRGGGYDQRQNDPLSLPLDAAMVQLAAEGDVEGVKALVSSSPQEATNINWPMQLLGFTESQAESITATVTQCSAEKRTELHNRLTENGVPEALIEADIMPSCDPDDMANVSQEFWQLYTNNKSLQIDTLMFGPTAHDQVKRSENILALMQAGVAYGKIETHMVPRMSSLTEEEREPYLANVTAFLETLKSTLPEGKTDLPAGLLNRALEVYRPNQVLAHAKWLYGDNAIAEMPNAINILTQYKTNSDGMVPFDEKILSKIEAIKGVEADLLGDFDDQSRIQALIYALGAEDPVDTLQDLQKLRGSTEFIGSEVRTYGEGEDAKEHTLNIPFMAHPKTWTRLLDSLPEGKDGERIKSMILDRLFLPQRMANLKDGAFYFYEDPAQAIRMFTEITPAPPESVKDKLYPLQVEMLRMLVAADGGTAIYDANKNITGFRGFPSTRQNKLKEVFFNDELAALYVELVEARKSGDEALRQYLEKHPDLQQPPTAEMNLTDLLGELRVSTDFYRREPQDAKAWIDKFATEPIKSSKLLAAWESRATALTYRDEDDPAFRVADNPNDIIHFMASHGLRLLITDKIKAGKETLTREELESAKPWIEAIGSRYSAASTLNMLEKVAKYKREHGRFPPKLLAPNSMNVTVQEAAVKKRDDGRTERVLVESAMVAEILADDDPGGFTIGYDTGCCMTLGGASESCIWAGYQDPNYAFFTVRDRGDRLRAQSILYIAEAMGKKYLVADNIEANGNTDVSKIAGIYRQALVEFIQQQNLDIDAIHIGVGYVQAGILDELADATVTPPTPRAGTYTDAAKQKVLWQKASD